MISVMTVGQSLMMFDCFEECAWWEKFLVSIN